MPLLLVIQYLRSRPPKTRPRFLHLCCIDQAKTSYHLVLWLQAPHKNSAVASLLLIPTQADQEVLSLDHHKWEVNLKYSPKSRQSMLVFNHFLRIFQIDKVFQEILPSLVHGYRNVSTMTRGIPRSIGKYFWKNLLK